VPRIDEICGDFDCLLDCFERPQVARIEKGHVAAGEQAAQGVGVVGVGAVEINGCGRYFAFTVELRLRCRD
jgi:hypothetical protein